jgi:hypothetical protein
MNHIEVGAYGEMLVYQVLQETGGRVGLGNGADVTFEGVKIEVKTAKPSKYNGKTLGYQFCLSKPGHTDFRKSDILVLIPLDANGSPRGAYVIPTGKLRDRVKITMPLSLETRFSAYREAWELLANI